MDLLSRFELFLSSDLLSLDGDFLDTDFSLLWLRDLDIRGSDDLASLASDEPFFDVDSVLEEGVVELVAVAAAVFLLR